MSGAIAPFALGPFYSNNPAKRQVA